MKKRILCASLAAALALLSFTACGTVDSRSKNGDESQAQKNVQSQQSEQTQTVDEPVKTAEVKAPENYGDAVNIFSSEMFVRCYDDKKGENTILSPLSMYMLLGMANNAAKGDTQSQINDVLSGYLNMKYSKVDYASKNPFTADQINASMSNYLHKSSNNIVLDIANSIFVMEREGLTLSEPFEKTVSDMYDAEIFYEKYSPEVVDKINSWVNDKTKEMIPAILNQNSINEDTVSVLLNAVAFEAAWADEFSDSQVFRNDFTNYDGNKTKVPYLCGTENFYIESDNATGFVKSYEITEDGGSYCFVAILPNEDVSIDDYVKSMNGETIKNLVENRESASVKMKMPKFSFDSNYALTSYFSQIGMDLMFDADKADFSKFFSSGKDSIYVSDVLHKAHIEVDEKGTKAAAATAMIMMDNAIEMVEETKEVYLDRPFVFAIYDYDEQFPLFIGTVCDLPEEEV